MSSPRHTVNVVLGPQHGREFVEDMRGVAKTTEQDDASTRTTPIEDFQLDAVLNGDERRDVCRWIFPFRGLLWRNGRARHQQEQRRPCEATSQSSTPRIRDGRLCSLPAMNEHCAR